jgi:2-dehydropantoate 2-reductase
MKIAVIGPGAIGCLFAAAFSKAGEDVWLIDHRPDRAHQLARRGLYVSGVSGEYRASVHVTTEPKQVRGAGLALIAVKSYATAEAAEAAKLALAPEGCAFTLQNGLGNIETLQAVLGEQCVLGGSTSVGATLIAPGQVHYAGAGPTLIGEPQGTLSDRLMGLEALFVRSGFQVELSTDLPAVLWGKLASNAGINAVATLAGVRNGGIMESTHLRRVMAAAVTEASRVAERKGIRLPHPDMVMHTEEICQRTANNVNSMLQDVNRQRRTEVGAINGAVVKAGLEVDLPTPTNALLASLIQGIEETYAARRAR